ncbi:MULTISPECIES: MerR family transcriptional regulator [Chitinophagaceae]
MLIGELSKKSGFSRDTIRFYEKQGLIKVSRKERRNNNYKEYSAEVLETLLTIKRVKSFGFTLNEAADLIGMIAAKDATCDNVSEMIGAKVELLDAKILDLLALRNQLVNGVQQCQARCNPKTPEDNCPILISDTFLQQ